MFFKIGDLVTRKSHNNDITFKIVDINNNIIYLKGVNIRLFADADVSDLVICHDCEDNIKDDDKVFERMTSIIKLNRDEYFYMPGKVLHIDGDSEYLNRCLDFYSKMNVMAFGVQLDERIVDKQIKSYLENYNPDIVVITGHDAFYTGKNSYKNSESFINAVKEARKYEKSHEKLFIIAGACQSDYENLIKSGANFASSPKRINIHALDPAIVASSISLSDKSNDIDLIKIINKTKYGKDGMGGIITKGSMYVGYPR